MSATIEIRLTNAGTAGSASGGSGGGVQFTPQIPNRPIYSSPPMPSSQSKASEKAGQNDGVLKRVLDQLERLAGVAQVETAFRTARELANAALELAQNIRGNKAADGTLLNQPVQATSQTSQVSQQLARETDRASNSMADVSMNADDAAYSLARLAIVANTLVEQFGQGTQRIGYNGGNTVEGSASGGSTEVVGKIGGPAEAKEGGEVGKQAGKAAAGMIGLASNIHPLIKIVALLGIATAKAVEVIGQKTRELGDYSPAIAMAQAEGEVKQFYAMMRRGEKLGTAGARFEAAKAGFNERWTDSYTKNIQVGMEIGTKLLETANATYDTVQKASVYAETLQDYGSAAITFFDGGDWRKEIQNASQRMIDYDKKKEAEKEESGLGIFAEFMMNTPGDLPEMNGGRLETNWDKAFAPPKIVGELGDLGI